VADAPQVPGGAAAQASAASRSGGSDGHVAKKAAGVTLPRARWIRRWL
jgi:hypothetical protein